jgi:hypothetical protein
VVLWFDREEKGKMECIDAKYVRPKWDVSIPFKSAGLPNVYPETPRSSMAMIALWPVPFPVSMYLSL